jgi:hypothetical protein
MKHNKISVGKPEGERSVRKPRRGWEINIEMNIKEVNALALVYRSG